MAIEMITLAQAAAPAATPQSSPVMMWGWMAIMAALFYFAIIRPQRRQQKERKEMMSKLKAGDRVLLTSGILGVVKVVKDNSVLVEVAANTQIETLRSAVSRIIDADTKLDSISQL